jgi:hypothetical protein
LLSKNWRKMESKDEWGCHLDLTIDDIRALYSVIDYALQTWPGAPARPVEEHQTCRGARVSSFYEEAIVCNDS